MKRATAILLAALVSLFLSFPSAFAEDCTDPDCDSTCDTPPLQADARPAYDFLAFHESAPEATLAVLRRAADLAQTGKWASAYAALTEFDPENADPYVLALKTDFVMKGNVQTYMHVVFAFIDLGEGQDLETVRLVGAEGVEPEPVEFDPGPIVRKYEEQGTGIPPVLHKILGDYYYVILTNYPGQWLEDDETLGTRILENYERAVAGGASDVQTLYNQGDILMRTGNNEGAARVLAQYIEAQPLDVEARKNYTKSLVSLARYDEAFAQADWIVAALTGTEQAGEGYMFAVQTAVNAGDSVKTEQYLATMQDANPDDFVPGLIRHLLAVREGREDDADAYADTVTAQTKANPDVVRSLLSSWLSVETPGPGLAYLERSIALYAADTDAMGTLNFYKSLMLAQTSQSVEELLAALALMEQAEAFYRQVRSEDDEIFVTIEELKQQMNEMIAPPGELPGNDPAGDPEYEADEEADATSAATDEWEETQEEPETVEEPAKAEETAPKTP